MCACEVVCRAGAKDTCTNDEYLGPIDTDCTHSEVIKIERLPVSPQGDSMTQRLETALCVEILKSSSLETLKP